MLDALHHCQLVDIVLTPCSRTPIPPAAPPVSTAATTASPLPPRITLAAGKVNTHAPIYTRIMEGSLSRAEDCCGPAQSRPAIGCHMQDSAPHSRFKSPRIQESAPHSKFRPTSLWRRVQGSSRRIQGSSRRVQGSGHPPHLNAPSLCHCAYGQMHISLGRGVAVDGFALHRPLQQPHVKVHSGQIGRVLLGLLVC